MRLLIVLTITTIITQKASSQSYSSNDEAFLYASTKQLNQFFRRFNAEEKADGTRLYEKDRFYHDPKIRQKYISILFDNEGKSIKPELKTEFINDMISKPYFFLDFHGGKWFAEVEAYFNWFGREEKITLFLIIQEEKVGSKWVLYRVKSDALESILAKEDTAQNHRFLHPMSHELDFLNLQKAFDDNRANIEDYTYRDFRADKLSIFLYEVKRGNINFNSVEKVKFHFFQANNWYFEVENFNREGNNTGWLISNLIKVANDKERNIIRSYIYNGK